jgi:hypothetical protein
VSLFTPGPFPSGSVPSFFLSLSLVPMLMFGSYGGLLQIRPRQPTLAIYTLDQNRLFFSLNIPLI